jgi:hypothetical protein
MSGLRQGSTFLFFPKPHKIVAYVLECGVGKARMKHFCLDGKERKKELAK